MDLNDFVKQVAEDGHRWFPKVDKNIVYTSLGLCGEVGEVTDVVKKYERYSMDWDALCIRLPEEIVDVLVYTLKLAYQIGIDLEEEYHKKRKVNEERFGHSTHDIRTLGRNGQ
jgi:NTP pyrophosphatase (non-canonical NTP hydrolase)